MSRSDVAVHRAVPALPASIAASASGKRSLCWASDSFVDPACGQARRRGDGCPGCGASAGRIPYLARSTELQPQ
jgi:hypothetical protein